MASAPSSAHACGSAPATASAKTAETLPPSALGESSRAPRSCSPSACPSPPPSTCPPADSPGRTRRPGQRCRAGRRRPCRPCSRARSTSRRTGRPTRRASGSRGPPPRAYRCPSAAISGPSAFRISFEVSRSVYFKYKCYNIILSIILLQEIIHFTSSRLTLLLWIMLFRKHIKTG